MRTKTVQDPGASYRELKSCESVWVKSGPDTEREIERGLAPDDDEDEFWKNMGMSMRPAGGVTNLSFLLAKAISPIASATTDPKSWGYKDIARQPEAEQKEWHDACHQELEALEW